MKIVLLSIFLLPFVCFAQVITTVAGAGSSPGSLTFVNGVPATACPIGSTAGIVTDEAGNFYFAGRNTGYIHKVSAGGIITAIVGDDSTKCFNEEGVPATTFSLNYPTGVTRDVAGNIYCSDLICHRAKKINTSGMLTSFAGTFGGFGGDGGLAVVAQFNNPGVMTADASGKVYICDMSNYRIRKINAAGVVTTIAGIGNGAYFGEGGPATAARIGMPMGITIDAANNICFTSGNCVRQISSAGIITTIAGTLGAGYSGDGGPATAAQVTPEGVAIDGSGNLYITDNTNRRIRRMTVPLSINSIANRISIYNTYPNPVKDIVYVSGVKGMMRYRLMNITGACCKEGTVSEDKNAIEVHSFPAGIYMLELTGVQGQKSVLKIIRE